MKTSLSRVLDLMPQFVLANFDIEINDPYHITGTFLFGVNMTITLENKGFKFLFIIDEFNNITSTKIQKIELMFNGILPIISRPINTSINIIDFLQKILKNEIVA